MNKVSASYKAVAKGGGSRYRDSEITVDLAAEENKFCGCWLCKFLNGGVIA